MILLDVFLHNTTSKTRWRMSMCSMTVRKLAEGISCEISSAIVFADEQPWTYPIGLICKLSPIPRNIRVADTWTTRTCKSFVHFQCYHMMRTLQITTKLSFSLCMHGDVDVIKHAIGIFDAHRSSNVIVDQRDKSINESLANIMYTPAVLIARGFDDLALRVLSWCCNQAFPIISTLTFNAACYAAYMCRCKWDSNIVGTPAIIAKIMHTYGIASPNPNEMLYAAMCQRGFMCVTEMPVMPGQGMTLISALVGGNPKIIDWCIQGMPAHINGAFGCIIALCAQTTPRISVDAFRQYILHYQGGLGPLICNKLPNDYISAMADNIPNTGSLVATLPCAITIQAHKRRGGKLSDVDVMHLFMYDHDDETSIMITELLACEGIHV